MFRKLFVPLLIFPLIVAACGGEQPTALEAAPTTEVDTATQVVATEILPSEVSSEEANPTETVAAAELVPAEFASECTLVSSVPEPSDQYAELFAVTESDWVYGPETAALTIVEYGDFQ